MIMASTTPERWYAWRSSAVGEGLYSFHDEAAAEAFARPQISDGGEWCVGTVTRTFSTYEAAKAFREGSYNDR
jgi:hypothetical protein